MEALRPNQHWRLKLKGKRHPIPRSAEYDAEKKEIHGLQDGKKKRRRTRSRSEENALSEESLPTWREKKRGRGKSAGRGLRGGRRRRGTSEF